eukprot:CAMPEP_0117008090 /NCGR_PEP_ID=MMETSP0472-20121206/7732_1 /TAXON_ID=693140 ORGANISM="Tiarina fusus, Strain LIS" /NCGR_SAMPLE_ID=MMETSP0472 /ASSEMBLY_ACC=CAM_ASM_000603 /LENGTH=128 /DNA_ID=CAMNT_0004710035 /DNA_START=70 /DNA_END=456 /DNA_ORIENTATION=+
MLYKRLLQCYLAFSAASTLVCGFNAGSPRKINSPSETSSVFSHRNANEECTLSSSVLASCDTLPSFPTAHGLLCPETVQRMARTAGPNDKVVARFLDRYHRYGPMSCIELLSDPDVLPHLTSALRSIA